METRPPTPIQLLIAVAFALSCFGLLLFLWLAFGGPTPLKPEGYRIHVPFQEATQLAIESDVRSSGVTIGKVKGVELSDEGDADATLEIDEEYAPLPENTRAILRQKTLLGETYVELTLGNRDGPKIPEGGTLASANVSNAVQLDEIFRTFDARTRAAFQQWMQGAAVALRGRGADLNAAFGELGPFSDSAERALRILDSQRLAVRRLVKNTGVVFQALSERRGQLQGLIRNSNTVFATTAQRNQDLQEAFIAFPTFLDESRLTLDRLERFAATSDPVVQQLRPAARELSPTLIKLGELAPELHGFFKGLRVVINHSKSGFRALRKLLGDDLPPLLTRLPAYLNQLTPIVTVLRQYEHEVTAFFANASSAINGAATPTGAPTQIKYLRTTSPIGPETLAAYPNRLRQNRNNPYVKPQGYNNLPSGLEGFRTSQCSNGVNATLDPTTPNNPAFNSRFDGDVDEATDFFNRLKKFTFNDQNSSNNVLAPPCKQQAPFRSIGMFPEFTQYLHVRALP
jgi:phospholipid/cholesterol/gamma-HCH transport system substrate-binding protein